MRIVDTLATAAFLAAFAFAAMHAMHLPALKPWAAWIADNDYGAFLLPWALMAAGIAAGLAVNGLIEWLIGDDS